MAKANLYFKICMHRNNLCKCITPKGKSTSDARFRSVKGLKSPNYDYWCQKNQCFNQATEEAMYNNNMLEELKRQYNDALSANSFSSPNEAFDFIEKGKCINHEYTFGEYIEVIIEYYKNPTDQLPTKNYMLYISLLHHIQRCKMNNILLADINDEHFEKFGYWLKNENTKDKDGNTKGCNYVNMMKVFHAVINKARKAKLTKIHLEYDYLKNKPKKIKADITAQEAVKEKRVKALTPKQYKKFLELDLNKIPTSGIDYAYRNELYRDFCILLYELRSRPYDIIKMKTDNITYSYEDKKKICIYTPQKKRNYDSNVTDPVASESVSPNAQRIIDKYAGKSKGGYLLPFSMNERKWNLNIADEAHKHYNRTNALEGQINRFLHKVGKQLKLPFTLTTYAFRRSVLTHELSKKTDILKLANAAGTSPNTILKHYVDRTQLTI